MLKHVRDIAEKYLIAGETHETAIMFVPSESVYADLHEKFEDVIQKSHRLRVIIASPNVLMLLVQTLQAIFKDARMREQAGLIKVEVTRLLEDVGRLKERVGDLQKHFGLANADLEKLGVSADKINRRGLRIESLDLTEPLLPEDSPAPQAGGARLNCPTCRSAADEDLRGDLALDVLEGGSDIGTILGDEEILGRDRRSNRSAACACPCREDRRRW